MVYVVEFEEDYGHSFVLGVFSSEAAAVSAAKRAKNKYPYDSLCISSYYIDIIHSESDKVYRIDNGVIQWA